MDYTTMRSLATYVEATTLIVGLVMLSAWPPRVWVLIACLGVAGAAETVYWVLA